MPSICILYELYDFELLDFLKLSLSYVNFIFDQIWKSPYIFQWLWRGGGGEKMKGIAIMIAPNGNFGVV
jgi:hypothetical protein